MRFRPFGFLHVDKSHGSTTLKDFWSRASSNTFLTTSFMPLAKQLSNINLMQKWLPKDELPGMSREAIIIYVVRVKLVYRSVDEYLNRWVLSPVFELWDLCFIPSNLLNWIELNIYSRLFWMLIESLSHLKVLKAFIKISQNECSLEYKRNVHGQIAVHIFQPNRGWNKLTILVTSLPAKCESLVAQDGG